MRKITGKTLTKPSSKANELPSGSSLAILIVGSAIILFVVVRSFFVSGDPVDISTPPPGFNPNAAAESTTTTTEQVTTTSVVEETTTTLPEEPSEANVIPVEIFGNPAVGFPDEARQAIYDLASVNAATPIVKIELIDWFDTQIAAHAITEAGQRIPVSLTLDADGTWISA